MLKRKTRLTRKTPLRADPAKVAEWKRNSATKLKQSPLKQRSKKRAKQERKYGSRHDDFLKEHPICPVTGDKTNQIHHSAKREGEWLNLERYWIAVSAKGHRWIEDNKREAEKYGLMVRIFEPFAVHCDRLVKTGNRLDVPMFYENHEILPLVNENGSPIYT